MWSVIGLFVVCVFIAAIEAPHLLLKKMKRELYLFLSILLFGFAISSLQALRVTLPNPLDWVTAMFKPISDITYDFLK
jgi:hypothetical protein